MPVLIFAFAYPVPPRIKHPLFKIEIKTRLCRLVNISLALDYWVSRVFTGFEVSIAKQSKWLPDEIIIEIIDRRCGMIITTVASCGCCCNSIRLLWCSSGCTMAVWKGVMSMYVCVNAVWSSYLLRLHTLLWTCVCEMILVYDKFSVALDVC